MAVVLCGLATYAETNPRPFTVPAIREWKGGVGQLALTADSRILYADSRLRAAAEMLAQDLQTLAGLRLSVASGSKAASSDILFSYRPQKKLGDEGYTIDIAKCVRVEAGERGALHAVQTILQLAGNEKAAIKNGN